MNKAYLADDGTAELLVRLKASFKVNLLTEEILRKIETLWEPGKELPFKIIFKHQLTGDATKTDYGFVCRMITTLQGVLFHPKDLINVASKIFPKYPCLLATAPIVFEGENYLFCLQTDNLEAILIPSGTTEFAYLPSLVIVST